MSRYVKLDFDQYHNSILEFPDSHSDWCDYFLSHSNNTEEWDDVIPDILIDLRAPDDPTKSKEYSLGRHIYIYPGIKGRLRSMKNSLNWDQFSCCIEENMDPRKMYKIKKLVDSLSKTYLFYLKALEISTLKELYPNTEMLLYLIHIFIGDRTSPVWDNEECIIKISKIDPENKKFLLEAATNMIPLTTILDYADEIDILRDAWESGVPINDIFV